MVLRKGRPSARSAAGREEFAAVLTLERRLGLAVGTRLPPNTRLDRLNGVVSDLASIVRAPAEERAH